VSLGEKFLTFGRTVLPSHSQSSTMKVKSLQSPALMGDAHSMIQHYVPKDCVSVTMTNQLTHAVWGSNAILKTIRNTKLYSVVTIQRLCSE
jgi:hypothetical protein